MVELLLKHGADPNLSPKRYPGGPLEAACGFLEAVQMLLDHGVEAVQILLDHGAVITPEALLAASGDDCDNDAILDLLLENGAVATSEALLKTVRNGCYERCKSLLNHGAPATSNILVAAWKRNDKRFTWQPTDGRPADLLLERGGVTASVLEEAEIMWSYEVEDYEMARAERVAIQNYDLGYDSSDDSDWDSESEAT